MKLILSEIFRESETGNSTKNMQPKTVTKQLFPMGLT